MNLSSPEEKKDLGITSIEDQKNIKSLIFEEELHLSSDLFQQETTVVLVKQFSDRKGIMERILPIDRIRNQEKLSNKIYLIPDIELSDNSFNQIDSKEPTGIFILVLISGLIFIRNESNHIKFNNFRKFFSYIVIVLLVSSGIITPVSISSSYWGTAFGEEMNNNNNTELTDHQINSLENFTNTVQISNHTELIPENYTTSISNHTELIPENYTTSISNHTELIPENYTTSISNHTELIPENYTT